MPLRAPIFALGLVGSVFLAHGCHIVADLEDHEPFPEDGSVTDGDTATIGLVQEQIGTGTGVSELALTLKTPPLLESALIVTIATNGPSDEHPTSITGGGVAWSVVSSSSSHMRTSLWAGFRVSASDSSVTVTWPAAQQSAVAHLSEWRGISATLSQQLSVGTESPVVAPPMTATTRGLVFATAATHAVEIGPASNAFTDLLGVKIPDVQLVSAYRVVDAGTYSTSWVPSTQGGWDAQSCLFGAN
jgi:hypothetical protein